MKGREEGEGGVRQRKGGGRRRRGAGRVTVIIVRTKACSTEKGNK